jgi:hypothetical protein
VSKELEELPPCACPYICYRHRTLGTPVKKQELNLVVERVQLGSITYIRPVGWMEVLG